MMVNNFTNINKIKSQKDHHTWCWRGSWCLTPLSTIFQLYRAGYDVGYQDSGLGQAQKCDWVNGIPTLLLMTGSQPYLLNDWIPTLPSRWLDLNPSLSMTGSQPYPLDDCIPTGSNGNTCLMSANDEKSADLLPLKKTTYYHKNEWQHKHGQYHSMVNEFL